MKVILYTGLTIDGYIAKIDGNTDWLSKQDFMDFNAICNQTRAVIFGRKSWDEMNPDWLPFKEGEGMYVILTRNQSLKSLNSLTVYSGSSAVDIVRLFEQLGYQEVCVAGGRETYGYFLRAGVVDELYVDYEPYILGQGIGFTPPEGLDIGLKLLNVSSIGGHTVQLHYQIEK